MQEKVNYSGDYFKGKNIEVCAVSRCTKLVLGNIPPHATKGDIITSLQDADVGRGSLSSMTFNTGQEYALVEFKIFSRKLLPS